MSDPKIDYIMSGVAVTELVVTVVLCFLVGKYFHAKVKIL